MNDLLRVQDLHIYYHTRPGAVKAANDVSFTLGRGEKLGLVGESGSGKTTTMLGLMRLVPEPGRIEGGEILLNQTDILRLPRERMRQIRGAEISMIPQGAMNSLNPVMRIEDQTVDTLKAHGVRMSKEGFRRRIRTVLERVGLNGQVAEMYPHELSGGMKQRVCIANAIIMNPQVIIADEPTSALDVVVQRRIMGTLDKLQRDMGASVILIGHDMGLMAQFVTKLGVMYAGKMVEVSPVEDVFEKPLHPYTQLLISTLPSLDVKGIFKGIGGMPPSLVDLPPGCAFHPRCPEARKICAEKEPPFVEVEPGQSVACHLNGSGSRP